MVSAEDGTTKLSTKTRAMIPRKFSSNS